MELTHKNLSYECAYILTITTEECLQILQGTHPDLILDKIVPDMYLTVDELDTYFMHYVTYFACFHTSKHDSFNKEHKNYAFIVIHGKYFIPAEPTLIII